MELAPAYVAVAGDVVFYFFKRDRMAPLRKAVFSAKNAFAVHFGVLGHPFKRIKCREFTTAKLRDQTELSRTSAVIRTRLNDHPRHACAEIQYSARNGEDLVLGMRAVHIIRYFIKRADQPPA